MRIIHQANRTTGQGATFGSLWKKVIEVRHQFPSMFNGCSIFVADNPFKKVSAVDRIAKAFPPLVPGIYENRGEGEMLKRAITNVGALANAQVPFPASGEWLSTATEIADGIPTRFPAIFAALSVHWAEHVCRQPDQRDSRIGRIATTQSNDPLFLGIRVVKNVDDLWLTALVDLGEVTKKTQAMPKIPASVQSVIDKFGGAWWFLTAFVPNETERADLQRKLVQARVLTDRHRKMAVELHASLPAMRNPQLMQDEAFADLDRRPSELDHVKNFRPEFVKTFKQMGYDYDKVRSEPRLHVMTKRTDRGNVIEILMDAGGFGKPRICSFDLGAHGPGWETDRVGLFQHRVLTTADWIQANRNAVSVLSGVEKTFAAEIDGLYGNSPSWFIHCGKLIHP